MTDGPSSSCSTRSTGPTSCRADDPAELVEEAERLRAPAASSWRSGEGGFFSQYSEFPPGYTVPLHRHDHDEMIVLLDGGCTMSRRSSLGAHDSVVLTAGFEYGFTAGDDGMVFLTIRAGRATTTLA